MANPETLQSLLTANPQIQQLMEVREGDLVVVDMSTDDVLFIFSL